MQLQTNQELSTTRLTSIDLFRGLAILGMVLANYLAGVGWISPWFKHAKDAGFTVIDLVAPMFLFAIGLTYGISFRGRLLREGTGKTYLHFVTRFSALLGMGALFGAGEVLLGVDGQTVNWGVLQAIGVAGLVTLLFLRLPTWGRLLSGLGILALYQSLLNEFWLMRILSEPHGGLLGSISWSGMLILATVFADIFFKPDCRKFWGCRQSDQPRLYWATRSNTPKQLQPPSVSVDRPAANRLWKLPNNPMDASLPSAMMRF